MDGILTLSKKSYSKVKAIKLSRKLKTPMAENSKEYTLKAKPPIYIGGDNPRKKLKKVLGNG